MNCPSCQNELGSSDAECLHCGFSLDVAVNRFGAVPRYSVHVTDMTYEELSVADYHKIKAGCERFERIFPQARFSVVLTRLLPGQGVREYGFYLFNKCRFSEATRRLGKNFGLLLVMDLQSSSMSLTVGYGLEPLLPGEALEKILDAGGTDFKARRWAAAALQCMHTARETLEAASKNSPTPVAASAV